ncbi:MAG: class I SAM-dependent methyltransferase [Christensenellales bacterium]
MSEIGNYARHARYWDWSGHDRSAEHAHWLNYAKKYGDHVLIPMCALGETGAHLARHGMHVTAFDVTPEMICEGKKRFGDIPGLALRTGDVCDFQFDIPPVDFSFCMDFQHLLTIQDVRRALTCIHAHLRVGGCLVIETGLHLPGKQSFETPVETFHPVKQAYPHVRVWKTGVTRGDAETGRTYISQTMYAEDENGQVESFDHSFYLQSYPRDAWHAAFSACGFALAGEYGSRDVASWQSGVEGFIIFEAVKTARASLDAGSGA